MLVPGDGPTRIGLFNGCISWWAHEHRQCSGLAHANLNHRRGQAKSREQWKQPEPLRPAALRAAFVALDTIMLPDLLKKSPCSAIGIGGVFSERSFGKNVRSAKRGATAKTFRDDSGAFAPSFGITHGPTVASWRVAQGCIPTVIAIR